MEVPHLQMSDMQTRQLHMIQKAVLPLLFLRRDINPVTSTCGTKVYAQFLQLHEGCKIDEVVGNELWFDDNTEVHEGLQ